MARHECNTIEVLWKDLKSSSHIHTHTEMLETQQNSLVEELLYGKMG